MAGPVDPIAETRRHYLAVLAGEMEERGLVTRPLGPDDSVLHVADPATGHTTMVVAMPSSPVTWSYLWSGGGAASAGDPADAAERIAASLR
jgi:hypothetical protein